MATLAALLASAADPSALSVPQLEMTAHGLLDHYDQLDEHDQSLGAIAQRTTVLASVAALQEEKKARPAGSVTASTGPRGTAGGGMAGRMTGTRGPAVGSPTATMRRFGSTITAAASGGKITAGMALTSSVQLGELVVETIRSLAPGLAPDPRRATLIHQRWEYPEERQLGDSLHQNTERIERVCGLGAPRYDRTSGALVATGEIPGPVGVDYQVPVFSTADRPVRDALPQFQATRGGVRYMSPPDIGVPSLQGTPSGAGTSVGIWSEATDANPAGSVKPVWVVPCGSEELVYVNAVPTRCSFGNLQASFDPEFAAANMQQAISVSAREAELELITQIANASKQVVPSEYVGAARDILSALDLLKSQYCYSHRIPRSTAFTALFPDWARDVIRADMAREMAHQNDSGNINALAISDEQIDQWFGVRGVNVIWSLDALKAGTYGTGGTAIPDQWFPILGSGAPVPQWPGGQSGNSAFTLAWFLFPEGTFQLLDGGRLDLGVVRDSLLDAQNSYETFTEVFEAVALRGLEAYQVQSALKPTGGSAGTVAASSYSE